MKRHVIIGLGAAALLLLVYFGIIALAQGVEHALDQTWDLWYWVVALASGFGIQAGLYSFIRKGLSDRKAAATASVTASGGVSTGSMVACCAHHLSDVLPALGLSGAAAFLAQYQSIFILAGVLSNLVGITIMLEVIQRHGLSQRLAGLNWSIGRVKRVTVLAGGLILGITLVFNFLAPGGT